MIIIEQLFPYATRLEALEGLRQRSRHMINRKMLEEEEEEIEEEPDDFSGTTENPDR